MDGGIIEHQKAIRKFKRGFLADFNYALVIVVFIHDFGFSGFGFVLWLCFPLFACGEMTHIV